MQINPIVQVTDYTDKSFWTSLWYHQIPCSKQLSMRRISTMNACMFLLGDGIVCYPVSSCEVDQRSCHSGTEDWAEIQENSQSSREAWRGKQWFCEQEWKGRWSICDEDQTDCYCWCQRRWKCLPAERSASSPKCHPYQGTHSGTSNSHGPCLLNWMNRFGVS